VSATSELVAGRYCFTALLLPRCHRLMVCSCPHGSFLLFHCLVNLSGRNIFSYTCAGVCIFKLFSTSSKSGHQRTENFCPFSFHNHWNKLQIIYVLLFGHVGSVFVCVQLWTSSSDELETQCYQILSSALTFLDYRAEDICNVKGESMDCVLSRRKFGQTKKFLSRDKRVRGRNFVHLYKMIS
jgi:hypothetical protein